MSHVLGIDVSTTATKVVVVDPNGKVVGTGSSEYPFLTPHPRWAEQQPELWWSGATKAIPAALQDARVAGADIEAVGLTGQMHGAVLLDSAGTVLRPAILWNDQRSDEECREIREAIGKERLIRITGNDAMTGFTAPKLAWVRRHEPDVWTRVRHLLLPKDYLRYRLTDEYAIDKADGSGTLLFDVAARNWSDEVLAALEIDREWLPDTYEGPQVTGSITTEAARSTGLHPGTPVVAGGGDQSANAVGVGAISPGVVALSLGTSGVTFATTPAPVIEPEGRVHCFCHAVPGRWHMMGVMLSAAGSLRWFRDAFAPNVAFEELVEPAAGVRPGSDGVLFLPYLSGERTPYADPDATGAFVGLTVRHDRRHLVRAVMEGVAFGIRDGLDLMTAAGLSPPKQVRASGGGIKSPLWRQILADVLECEIATTETAEGAAYGAGLLALVGSGRFSSVEEACAATVRVRSGPEPGPGVAAYREAHARYRLLYPALRSVHGPARASELSAG